MKCLGDFGKSEGLSYLTNRFQCRGWRLEGRASLWIGNQRGTKLRSKSFVLNGRKSCFEINPVAVGLLFPSQKGVALFEAGCLKKGDCNRVGLLGYCQKELQAIPIMIWFSKQKKQWETPTSPQGFHFDKWDFWNSRKTRRNSKKKLNENSGGSKIVHRVLAFIHLKSILGLSTDLKESKGLSKKRRLGQRIAGAWGWGQP